MDDNMKRERHGVSYQKRVEDINRIYDRYAALGLTNRAIWRQHIYPIYGISERTFYKYLKASAYEKYVITDAGTRSQLLFAGDSTDEL